MFAASTTATSIAASLGLSRGVRKRTTPILESGTKVPSPPLSAPSPLPSPNISHEEFCERVPTTQSSEVDLGGVRLVEPPSPSIYDEEQDEHVEGYSDGSPVASVVTKSDAGDEVVWKGRSTSGIRQDQGDLGGSEPLENPFATPKEPNQGGSTMSRNSSIATADRPFVGRSISYRAPKKVDGSPGLPILSFQNTGATISGILASLPPHLRPTFPPDAQLPTWVATQVSAPEFRLRTESQIYFAPSSSLLQSGSSSSTTSTTQLARTFSTISTSTTSYVNRMLNLPYLSRSKTMTRGTTTSSYGSTNTSGRSIRTVDRVKYVQKWPDRWLEAQRLKNSFQGVEGLGKSECSHWGIVTDDGRLVQCGGRKQANKKEGYWEKIWTQAERRGGLSLEGDDSEEAAWSQGRGWTWQKWALLGSILVLFSYSLGGLICALLTWFRTWPHADVVLVANGNVLTYLTLASLFSLLVSTIGLIGSLLDSRPLLAAYAILLWPCGFMILAMGYSSYRMFALRLDLKLNQAWSQFYDDGHRLRIQGSLDCCGWFSPYHEATFSKQCYPRTTLPGCKGPLYKFEKAFLRKCYEAAFGIAPVHVGIIFIAMICANHINRTFGKGLMPRTYRLTAQSVKENALLALQTLPSPRSPNASRSTCVESIGSVKVSMIPGSESDISLVGLGVSHGSLEV